MWQHLMTPGRNFPGTCADLLAASGAFHGVYKERAPQVDPAGGQNHTTTDPKMAKLLRVCHGVWAQEGQPWMRLHSRGLWRLALSASLPLWGLNYSSGVAMDAVAFGTLHRGQSAPCGSCIEQCAWCFWRQFAECDPSLVAFPYCFSVLQINAHHASGWEWQFKDTPR